MVRGKEMKADIDNIISAIYNDIADLVNTLANEANKTDIKIDIAAGFNSSANQLSIKVNQEIIKTFAFDLDE